VLVTRGEKVMIDADMAELHGVATKVLIEPAKNCFPFDVARAA